MIVYKSSLPPGFKWWSEPEKWASDLKKILAWLTVLFLLLWENKYYGNRFEMHLLVASLTTLVLLHWLAFKINSGKFDSERDWLYRTRDEALANWWLENPNAAPMTHAEIRVDQGFVMIKAIEMTIVQGCGNQRLLIWLRSHFASDWALEHWLLDEGRRTGDTLSQQAHSRMLNSSRA